MHNRINIEPAAPAPTPESYGDVWSDGRNAWIVAQINRHGPDTGLINLRTGSLWSASSALPYRPSHSQVAEHLGVSIADIYGPLRLEGHVGPRNA